MLFVTVVLVLVNVFLDVSSLQVVKHEIPSGIGSSLQNGLGIVGGSNTTIKEHPYQCAVLYYDSFFCACAILNKDWVLTLGDCIYGVSEENYKIRVGSNSSSEGGTLYGVNQLKIHPNYNVSTRDYDLGLIKLSESLKFNNNVKKVKLPTNALKTGQKAVITGWGDNSIGNQFKELNVKGVDHTKCEKVYSPYNYLVTDSMVCATAAGAGPCTKDSGDPLVNNNKLFGLFAWCFNCGDDSFPAVYSSIPAGVSWIKFTIKG